MSARWDHLHSTRDRYSNLFPDVRTFYVSPEIVKANRDWSNPVQVKFAEQENGSVCMWVGTVKDDD